VTSIPATQETSWLLLIHQIPPKPDYLRVKIGRRLQRIGAVPVKNSVYVLPDRPQSLEDFQWVRAEIIDGGGDASICQANFVDGLTNSQLEHVFQSARDADYADLADSAREVWSALRRRDRDAGRQRPTRVEEEIARLRKRLSTIASIDFFGATGRRVAEDAVRAVADELELTSESPNAVPNQPDRSAYRGRTWVTRSGIFVDRIASAWLIRRFIDRDAKFKFVSSAKYRGVHGELRFDMFEGEFTHQGDCCTFETLIEMFALRDPALHSIAEIVHDIDLKDEKFGRDDASGVERVLKGITAANAEDDARLERGSQLFDDLYAVFSAESKASGVDAAGGN
jgi:hypothetical protein